MRITRVRLAHRQRQVLLGLLYGLSVKQVATVLAVSEHTAHSYIKKLYAAFAVNSRGELLALWIDQRLASDSLGVTLDEALIAQISSPIIGSHLEREGITVAV